MEQAVGFPSDGLTLRGVIHLPEGAAQPRPALVQCHGFGGGCRGAGHPELALALEAAGYVVLRFDFRGCSQSDGERGSVICEEEVADLRHAIDFLTTQPGVDAARIGVIGASLGGSVAIVAAARDPRIKLCIANGSIGRGERRFRAQYPDETAWQAFLARLAQAQRSNTKLNRFDIVAIPERDRGGLPPGAIMEFTAATAQSLLDFNPEEVVARIAPRPLLLVHPRGDAVVPAAESDALAAAAGPSCEKHIIAGDAHFGAGSPAIVALVRDFLARHLPAG
jgi:hypothetical protein